MLLVSLASETAAWRVTSDGTCMLREGQKRVDELCSQSSSTGFGERDRHQQRRVNQLLATTYAQCKGTHRFSLLRRLRVLSPLILLDMGHSDASHGTLPPPPLSRPGLFRPPPPPSLLSNSSSP